MKMRRRRARVRMIKDEDEKNDKCIIWTVHCLNFHFTYNDVYGWKTQCCYGSLNFLSPFFFSHVDEVYVATTTKITKVVASTMYTSTPRISDMSPITVATAAAQCIAVTLTTTSPVMISSVGHSRTKPSPGQRRGRKHDEGWNVVIRR